MSSKKVTPALLALAFLLLASPAARADGLLLTLSNPNQSVAYNGTATFLGMLANDSVLDLNIGTPGFTLPGQRVPFSYSVTITGNTCPSCGSGLIRYGLTGVNNPEIPTSLAAMSTTGEVRLFDVGWGSGNQPLTVTGIFTVNYYVSGAGGPVRSVSQAFSINVAPIPEPATLILLGTGLAGVAARYRRRGKRPTA